MVKPGIIFTRNEQYTNGMHNTGIRTLYWHNSQIESIELHPNTNCSNVR